MLEHIKKIIHDSFQGRSSHGGTLGPSMAKSSWLSTFKFSSAWLGRIWSAQGTSSRQIWATNLNCSVKSDLSEPHLDVLFSGGQWVIMLSTHLTSQNMLTAFTSHIQTRTTAAGAGATSSASSACKPGLTWYWEFGRDQEPDISLEAG